MIELTKPCIKSWQRYSYNGKIEVGPNSTQVPQTQIDDVDCNCINILNKPKLLFVC